MRYVLRNESNSPVGRLFVSAEPAMRMDGQPVIQLTLTAKGQPPTPDLDGVRTFLSQGREQIVRGFTELTSKKMHDTWGRTR